MQTFDIEGQECCVLFQQLTQRVCTCFSELVACGKCPVKGTVVSHLMVA